jgi:hypothetical protein
LRKHGWIISVEDWLRGYKFVLKPPFITLGEKAIVKLMSKEYARKKIMVE